MTGEAGGDVSIKLSLGRALGGRAGAGAGSVKMVVAAAEVARTDLNVPG